MGSERFPLRRLATSSVRFQLSEARATHLSMEARVGEGPPGAPTGMTVSAGREAAFIGKITAAATHEIRNVLAIIKESAGLVEDLLYVSTQGGSLDRERVLKALGRIEAQVARGAEISTQLNRVAHATDHDAATVSLDEEVRRVVFHAQRPARKKSQLVRAVDGTPPPPFQGNVLHVHMAVYAALETCLERLGEGGTVEVRAGMSRGRPSVSLTTSAGGDAADDAAEWDGLRDSLEHLGVSLESSGNGDGLMLLFQPYG